MYTLRPYRCDFHIHSPRDRRYKGWPVDRMTLDGLYDWARILLSECRKRAVNVVGITDHHDLVSAFITLEVAMNEGYKDICVFPGLEITSEQGIQAILLLNPTIALGDGSYPASSTEALQNKILTALGQYIMAAQDPAVILQAPSWIELQGLHKLPEDARAEKFKTPRVERLNKSLEAIAESMEDHFRDQFVLLPNIEKSSKHSLFGNPAGRALYISAKDWFVGGIISGPNETDETIIQGKNKQDYGSRVVACLRSSDQRGDDENSICRYFGQSDRASWLKLSEPSTISITQALISGCGCRVFDEEPKMPAEYISAVAISGADIFTQEELSLKFSPSLNTLIGGRGTGKSLVLSALMRVFGLDHEWIEKSKQSPETLSAWEKRHVALFQDDGPFDNSLISITVEYIKEPEVRYRLTLHSPNFSGSARWSLDTHTGEQWEKISEYDCCPDSIDICPMFFLQGQMSSLTGEYQEDLTRLIEGPIRGIRAGLRAEIEVLSGTVREGYDNAIRLTKLKHEVDRLDGQIKQKSTEQEAFQKIAQAGLTDTEKALFEAANPLDLGSRATVEIESSMHTLMVELQQRRDQLQEDLKGELAGIKTLRLLDVSKFTEEEGFSDDPYLISLELIYENIISKLSGLIDLGQASLLALQDKRSQFNERMRCLAETANSIAEREHHRKEAKIKADGLGGEISILQGKRKEAQKEIASIEMSGLIKKGEEALARYKELVSEYSKKLVIRATEISNDKDLRLYVKIIPGGRFSDVIEQLSEMVYGAKVPSKTWEEMKAFLSCHKEPAKAISELIHSAISALKAGGCNTAPEIWTKCGFSEKVFNNIIERTTIEDWIKLSVILAEDHVEVKYKRSGQTPIPILNASPGERAVELLRLSLQTTTGPIIIDQPEDDLDNDFLAHHLVDLVHHAKGRNQLIFASHSANLVVHGDSDMIHVMDTKEDGAGKGSCYQLSAGTIDQPDICREIEAIMEGGRGAFESRRRKYHETIDPLSSFTCS